MALPANVMAYATAAALNAALGTYIADAARAAIEARGRFVLATSGGSLPKNLGDALQLAVDAGADLQTDKWHVFYVDERVVPLDHPDSNHNANRATLYTRAWFKTPIGQIHAIDASLAPADCAAEYEAQILSLFGATAADTPVFDVVLLGMGPDGHTASLFPGHALLGDASRLIAPITDSPKPPPTRVTFTYRLLNAAERVAFVALGEGKADVLAAVFDESVPAAEQLPSARVRQAGSSKPTWFVDEPAAKKLYK